MFSCKNQFAPNYRVRVSRPIYVSAKFKMDKKHVCFLSILNFACLHEIMQHNLFVEMIYYIDNLSSLCSWLHKFLGQQIVSLVLQKSALTLKMWCQVPTHEILMIASLWKRKQSKKVPLRTDSVDRWFFCGQSNYVTLLNSPILNLAVTPDLLRVSLWSNHLKSCKVYHDLQWTFDSDRKFSFEIVFVCSHLGWCYTCMRLYNVVPVQSFGFT